MLEKIIKKIAAEIKKQLLSVDATVAILRIQPGDTIVLKTERSVSDIAYQHITASMKEMFPENKTLILEEGLDLSIVRKNNDKLNVVET